eukprot:TRINITY_DN20706_c0_g1_i1.p1 TRINITY_DN20706_c0_g1~~TRINITY_DN20706_c0_g1_i1.p1  ORF type:complete len:886 (+),score=170.32 TRINITY_DN20706_c0_g1_i1:54-2711(+)
MLGQMEQAEEVLLDAVEKGAESIGLVSAPKTTKEASRATSIYGEETFMWNNKECSGNKLHLAVLQENKGEAYEEVKRILERGECQACGRFAYLTEYNGKSQECSGAPIHLAASRGHIDVVQLLLDQRASIESKVKRGERDNYDVVHAAVFAEGRGGSKEMIRYLCGSTIGASIMSKNANGVTCMHLAFQTGNMETISAVRSHMKRTESPCRFSDAQDVAWDDPKRKVTPLELGIDVGKMNKEQLAAAASPTSSCLKTFIHRAPECIKPFMDRITNKRLATPEDLADTLTRKDIASLLRETPEAALALLDGCEARPEETSPGWHPLPSRVSFAARDTGRWSRQIFKRILPTRRLLVLYEDEKEWSYNDRAYKAPAWHKKLTSKDYGRPFYDADIKVCHVPNIISPDFFAALMHTSSLGDGSLYLYENATVRAAIYFTFWKGALWVDFAQTSLSIWGLALLVFETWLIHETAAGAEMDHLSDTALGHYTDSVFMPSSLGTEQSGVVADWIIAKGIMDCFLECVQMFGCWKIAQPCSYFNAGNAWDVFRSIVPVLLFFFSGHRVLHLLIVLIYWIRLLEGITYTENIGHALLPMQRLATGLMPALSFTLVGFCALTHAMYTVQESPQRLWPDTLFEGFSTLITQGLPGRPPADTLELLVMYGGVLFFSVFVLNIFIGVIGEQYAHEKEQVGLIFQNVRASSCLTFLLRALVLPCDLITSKCAAYVVIAANSVALGAQVLSLGWGIRLPGVGQLVIFLICQFTTFIATIQCKNSPYPWADSAHWTCKEARGGFSTIMDRKYLWFCEPRDEMNKDAKVEEDRGSVLARTRSTGVPFASGSPKKSLQVDSEELVQVVRRAICEARMPNATPDLPTLLRGPATTQQSKDPVV